MYTITREVLYRSLRAVQDFMSADATRFHLCGVYLEQDGNSGLSIVATDGHTMAIVRPIIKVSGQNDPVIVKGEDVETLVKLIKPSKQNGHHELTFTTADKTFQVLGQDVQFERKGIDSQFPPWRAVVPEEGGKGTIKGPERVMLQATYVGRAAEAAKRLGVSPRSTKQMRIGWVASELDPVRMDIDEEDTGSLAMVIMPMRM